MLLVVVCSTRSVVEDQHKLYVFYTVINSSKVKLLCHHLKMFPRDDFTSTYVLLLRLYDSFIHEICKGWNVVDEGGIQ